MNPGLIRTAGLLSGIILGALLPQAHVLSWAIRWLVFAMLFLVFLQTRFSRSAMDRTHAILLGANVVLGFAGFGLGWMVGGREVALSSFFAGITPTAIAAPVVISFLRGRVEYVIAAFLLTNVAIAALLPLILPIVLGRATPEAFVHVLGSVGLVVFAPMLVARLVRALQPRAQEWPARLRNLSFGLWIVSLFLITSSASDFIHRQSDAPRLLLGQIAACSLLVCAINFAVGYWIGGKDFRREASQSLGQKNTTFTIYLALTYASPMVALGPTFYVIWHNLWNSWQLHRAGRRDA